MDEATTSTAITDEQITLDSLGPQTIRTLKRIISEVQLDKNINPESFTLTDPMARTMKYTGMNWLNLQKLQVFGGNLDYVTPVTINRTTVHSHWLNMYVSKKLIPTIKELYQSLGGILPSYVDLDSFTKILVDMGYVFYKYPGKKSLRVMEKKSVIFDRYRYLKSIVQYREEKAKIVYIGVVSVTKEKILISLENTLQTDPENILHYILFTVTSEEMNNIKVLPPSSHEVLQDAVKDWLLKLLSVKNLREGSVCVVEDTKIFRETILDVPTWKSVKADMVEWLEEHNVPCDINMSKSELLDLIDTCTDTSKNTFVIDNLVKLQGYSLLRLPDCINGLSIVYFMIRFVNLKGCLKDGGLQIYNVEEIFSVVTLQNLEHFSFAIRKEEKKILNDEKHFDIALDRLVAGITSSDVESDDDGMILPFSDSE